MLRELIGVATGFLFVGAWFKAVVTSDPKWIAASVVIGISALVLLRPGKDVRDPREALKKKEAEAIAREEDSRQLVSKN